MSDGDHTEIRGRLEAAGTWYHNLLIIARRYKGRPGALERQLTAKLVEAEAIVLPDMRELARDPSFNRFRAVLEPDSEDAKRRHALDALVETWRPLRELGAALAELQAKLDALPPYGWPYLADEDGHRWAAAARLALELLDYRGPAGDVFWVCDFTEKQTICALLAHYPRAHPDGINERSVTFSQRDIAALVGCYPNAIHNHLEAAARKYEPVQHLVGLFCGLFDFEAAFPQTLHLASELIRSRKQMARWSWFVEDLSRRREDAILTEGQLPEDSFADAW